MAIEAQVSKIEIFSRSCIQCGESLSTVGMVAFQKFYELSNIVLSWIFANQTKGLLVVIDCKKWS